MLSLARCDFRGMVGIAVPLRMDAFARLAVVDEDKDDGHAAMMTPLLWKNQRQICSA
jgi:hypothetical protein